MSGWNDILFFPGEDAEALKSRFVKLCADFPGFQPIDNARKVFKGLPNPELRIETAARVWAADPKVQARIADARIKEPYKVECDQPSLIRRTLQIADDIQAEKSTRLAAIRLAGELQGLIIKAIDKKVENLTASGIPSITIKCRGV